MIPSQSTAAPATVTASARKAHKVAWISAVVVVIVFTAIALTLHGKTESGESVFHPEDQVAMIILGLLAAGGVLMFTRPRIVADDGGVRLRNLLGWKHIPWEVITAVRFDRGHSWASLELQDDDTIAIMAIQAADKKYALDTVRALCTMLATHRTGPAT